MPSRKQIDFYHKIAMDASPPSLHTWDPIQGRGSSFLPSPTWACCHVPINRAWPKANGRGGRDPGWPLTRRLAGGALGGGFRRGWSTGVISAWPPGPAGGPVGGTQERLWEELWAAAVGEQSSGMRCAQAKRKGTGEAGLK